MIIENNWKNEYVKSILKEKDLTVADEILSKEHPKYLYKYMGISDRNIDNFKNYCLWERCGRCLKG